MSLDPAGERARLEAVIGSYGQVAAPFDAAMRGFMMRAFEPFFRDGPCLQVGCAHGDQTSLLVERFAEVTVVEPTAAFIAETRRRVGDRARFVQALVEDYDPEDRFETILFSHVLEHVADAPGVLAKLASLLTLSGRLFVVVPNAEAPSRRIAVKMGVLDHLEALSADDRAAGLPIEHTGGIFFKPLANFQLNALIGGPLMGESFLEGCYQLGREDAASCASIYAIAGRPD